MSDSGPTKKICVVCGENCAGMPRVRDPRGRYFCEECYELSRDEAQSYKPVDPPSEELLDEILGYADPGSTAGTTGFVSGSAMMPGAFESSGLSEASGAPVAAAATGSSRATTFHGEACPGCGMQIVGHAALCANCGHVLREDDSSAQHGESLEESLLNAWPMGIAAISIILGGIGVVNYGAGTVIAGINLNAGGIVGSIIAMALSIWLMRGGLALRYRLTSAVVSLQQWAYCKIILSIVCVGAAVIYRVIAIKNEVHWRLRGVGAVELPLSSSYGILLALLIWMIIWPVFLRAWFSRDAVLTEVARWH